MARRDPSDCLVRAMPLLEAKFVTQKLEQQRFAICKLKSNTATTTSTQLLRLLLRLLLLPTHLLYSTLLYSILLYSAQMRKRHPRMTSVAPARPWFLRHA